ncbi:MAG: glutamine amidotransferase [Burkholderiales bacterium]|jgi:GMP synthase (glutamine-hydrolysing)|nr:glutamine amidotransferase [Burkholderiales bacterium]MCA3162715.1 glutamine amidotransferase [Burkholderiales bacterium]MCA3166477.1 glutamine amidotransferase [Burkholderiales bacterium]MCA3171274.1 glutamine amidotransferase [Burkholderiales bacterium]MCA3172781.1 glutamine amidotransferase [Burkholderiales bacterium]
MKTCVALRHLMFEDLGLLEPMLNADGWRIFYYELGVGQLQKISLDQVDLLVILGGPIGAEDDEQYPFLKDEVALIRDRLATRKLMLGICLGAQLIARAMGSRVKPMKEKEIGFTSLTFTAEGLNSPLAEIGMQPVFHWHGDQFDLPTGIKSLASTPKCPNQAFQVEHHTLALQFHIEIDTNRIEQWLIGHGAEIQQCAISTNILRNDAIRYGSGMSDAMRGVINQWITDVRHFDH